MTTNDAGLRQSQAVTSAAQELSRAKSELSHIRNTLWAYTGGPGERFPEAEGRRKVDEAKDRLAAARAQYKAAFLAYTNPFGVRKTV
ncbi:hypothetical protein SEA_ZOOMAN_300 [Microbacterium phage Zooman]|nr:hypothetical protein SEA_ZOOMAN_300 [Microbacterium phage Zooman]